MPNRKRAPARVRLLDAAEDMLREVGMAGTGIKDVVARSGAPIGSLYHYFPDGKTQLVCEALQIQADKSGELLKRFFDPTTSLATALRSLFNTAADGFERAGANKGCAIGAVTLDLMPGDTAVRSICRSTFDQWVEIIAPRVPCSDQRSRRSFAVTIVAALEGAFVLARAAHSGDPFRQVGKALAAMVSSAPRSAPRALE
jgi:AcrR family transcriptional regulator